jgi:hypothetical protein
MQLRALGFRISIDDFGTGYSSLSYLRHFPVDALKIDRSFVRGLRADDDSTAIIRSMTSMARQLALHVVAEGIEREEHVPLLRALDCDSGQGYLFARPLSAEAAAETLKKGIPPLQSAATDTAAAPEARAAATVDTTRTRTTRDGKSTWTLPLVRLFTLQGQGVAIAMAIISVVALAGLANRFAGPWASPSAAPVIGTSPTAATSPAATTATPATATTAASTVIAPKAPDAKRKSTVASGTPQTPHEAVKAPARVNDASTADRLISPGSTKPESPRRSWRVEHLHRFGHCEGRLTASHNGLIFAPENDADDAFTLAHEDYRSSADGGTLTIRTAGKTYRFKLLGVPSSHDASRAIKNLADTLTHARAGKSID